MLSAYHTSIEGMLALDYQEWMTNLQLTLWLFDAKFMCLYTSVVSTYSAIIILIHVLAATKTKLYQLPVISLNACTKVELSFVAPECSCRPSSNSHPTSSISAAQSTSIVLVPASSCKLLTICWLPGSRPGNLVSTMKQKGEENTHLEGSLQVAPFVSPYCSW